MSSQNFSPAGIEQNRDAGLIIDSQDLAKYFGPIFLSDWNQKAKPFAPKATAQQTKRKAPVKKSIAKHPRNASTR